MMMQTTEDSCPIICNVQISAICLSSSTYVTGLDSCDVAKAGVHKNVCHLERWTCERLYGFEPVLLYISDAEIPSQIIVKSASDAEIPRPRKNRGSIAVWYKISYPINLSASNFGSIRFGHKPKLTCSTP